MQKLKCILLVDDHHPTNVLHKLLLEKANLVDHIVTFTDPKEAINYLSDEKSSSYIEPEFIFLDVNMPGMNGWEFLDEYETLGLTEKNKSLIFMLSTSSFSEDLEKAEKNSEVKHYLKKPLMAIQVEALIGTYT